MPHRPMAYRFATGSTLLLVVAAVALVVGPSPTQAAPMELERYGDTVSGMFNIPGTANGFRGSSRLQSPLAMCGGHLSTAVDPARELSLIGTSNQFRTFNRTDMYTGVWFGGQDSGDRDGPIATATVSTVYGCTRYNDAAPVIYFVTGTRFIRYVANGIVSSHFVADGVVLQDVTEYQNQLYVIDGQQNNVYRCSISATNPEPQRCEQITLNAINTLPAPISVQRGITVNARGIFIATTRALAWYRNPPPGIAADLVQRDVARAFVDIASLTTTGTQTTLLGVTNTGIYNITASVSDTWSVALLAGTGATSACTATGDNADGFNPTFCGLYHLFPVSVDEVYFTLPDRSVVRSLTLPPMVVTYTFPRRPFPIGFFDSQADMNGLIDLMNSNLNGVLGTSDVRVNASAGFVEPNWWDTVFQIEVPQRDFDNVTTTPAIRGIAFAETLTQLAVYYNYTNEYVYTDLNIMPTCNRTQLNSIQHAVANRARDVLRYPLIYTDPPETTPVGDNLNITRLKLLLPARFGTAPGWDYNATTHPLLEAANFSTAIIEYVGASYAPDRVYTVRLRPSSQYPIENLDAAQRQQVRWMVRQDVLARLAQCAAQVGDPADGGQSVIIGNENASSGSDDGLSELVRGCVPQVGITNESFIENRGQAGYETDYTVYVPNTMNYTFDISACLDGMDTSNIAFWIGNVTASRRRKCETGCIVAVAVAAAVVAMVLIVALVVLVSKRRRLAMVVAPAAAGGEPKFSSTLDDEEDSLGSGGNPLRRG